ncbi:uncharacterized protein V1518DRAFT_386808 [Limtongia smithiae]|uniref:uncharacterized protein n=1 Tax=Limtongia smithiae TaxID=1125753 RepID=UPI0034CF6144
MTDLTVDQQIDQLNQAKQLVVKDTSFYPQIIRGILPIAHREDIRLRSWCAAFLNQGFASTDLKQSDKEELALECLDVLLVLFNETDSALLKNLIQCACSIYPLIFKHICTHNTAGEIWQKATAIKSKIISFWETGSEGLKLCCIKFVQRVVAVQTPGTKDPRLADATDVSLTMVPLNHPLIPIPVLEAEAQGLLDRLLSVFYERHINESVISASLYCGAALVRSRSTTVNKVIMRILAFDPLKADYDTNESAKLRLEVRFAEKNLRIVLGNMLKQSSIANQYGPRIQQYLTNLVQAKNMTADDIMRKRAADSNAGNDNVKRPRIEQPAPSVPDVASTAGPSYASLYTLIDPVISMASFDATMLPPTTAIEIAIASMMITSKDKIDAAVRAVTLRYSKMYPPPQIIKIEEDQSVMAAAVLAEQDDDADYEPDDYEPPDVTTSTAVASGQEIALGPLVDQLQPVDQNQPRNADMMDDFDDDDYYKDLANEQTSLISIQPSKLSQSDRLEVFQQVIERIVTNGGVIEKTIFDDISRRVGKDINDLSDVGVSRDIWIMLLSRLGTRGLSNAQSGTTKDTENMNSMAGFIRQKLYAYIMANFRERIDLAVTWLSEEWYNDKMSTQELQNGQDDSKDGDGATEESQYVKWTTKILDGVIPFLDVNDRIFLRFLSDLPELTPDMLSKLRILCKDPDRAKLGFLSLQYLIKLRPPVRDYCTDLLNSIRQENAAA